ncbi:hypothetical protein J051_1045 [Klebsiella pneumoniae 440_1540]|nr:hypothetical protein CSC00_4073 [Klebsiella pneumoniae]EOR19656.1 hypothetical protein H208_1615 [Klebsiella pneumoniae UHKPC23]EOY70197.1 hypothetical protein H207_1743 [Klebsiella pneumoniae UHKPC40]EOY84850.1 hypothetical protein H230_1761 [Klebsiella pneumoniae UHKPC09]EOY86209.1 hypothetical protein H231_1497 [Klebsiella pneumoniae UHKPC01]EOY92912.1 hypothetical protein H236_1238 [Klebsiella pneumoniae UHKPC26]EOZ01413.1 hypothetical protein H233_1567 [Klebsiella pneumoniae UHKPC27]
MIAQDNHTAETGFTPVNDGFIHKELRRSRYNVEEKQLYIY